MSEIRADGTPAALPIGYQFGDARWPPGCQRLFCAQCDAIVIVGHDIMNDAEKCRRGHIVHPPPDAGALEYAARFPNRTDMLVGAHTAAYTPPGQEHGRPCNDFRPWPSDGVVTLSSNVCATCDFTKREHR